MRHQAQDHNDKKKWSTPKKDGEKKDDCDASNKADKKQKKSAKKSGDDGSSSKAKGSDSNLKFNSSAKLLMAAGNDLNAWAFLS